MLSSARALCAALCCSIALCVLPASAAYCNMQSNATGRENTIPIDLSEPVFVASVPHGSLFTAGASADDRIHILHLYGDNAYDWGVATGRLLGPLINATLGSAYTYFVNQILQAINGSIITPLKIPPKIARMIAEKGLDFMLDWQASESSVFMDRAIFDEIRGIADATGLEYQMILRVHMIGEVTRGSCSFYGLYGPATLNGKVLQLRALDWDTQAGLQNHPTVTVYHPTKGSTLGVPFLNVGWAGWIGVLTGMSSNRIGISEIGIAYPDKSFGEESFVGIPFIFLERKVIQYASDVFDAMSLIQSANRTCDLVLGVADGNKKTARMVQYSYSVAHVMDWQNLEPHTPWHPRIDSAVYCAMDWICPYYQRVMAGQLTAMHGRITPELSIRNITSVVQTGSLHVAVYDLSDNILYVANAKGDQDVSGAKEAYARGFLRLNVTQLYETALPDAS